jgi:hypothetical protein
LSEYASLTYDSQVEVNHSTNEVANVWPPYSTTWSPSRPQSAALEIAEQQGQLTNTSTTSHTPTAGPTELPESWYFRHSGTPSDINTLSEKWMNSNQVAQLAQESGVFLFFVLIKLFDIDRAGATPIAGKFGDIEINQLDAAIEKYHTVCTFPRTVLVLYHLTIQSQVHGLTDGDIRQIILYKGKNKTNQPFWADVCKSVMDIWFLQL